MSALDAVALVLVIVLGAYLVVALLKQEDFL